MPGKSPDPQTGRPSLGLYDRPGLGTITGIEVIAILLSLVWLIGTVVFFLVARGEDASLEGLRFVMTLLTVFLPIGMIWIVATAARAGRVMREESARLQAAIDAIRQSYVAQMQKAAGGGDAAVLQKLNEIAATARKTEAALTGFAALRERAAAPPKPAGAGKPAEAPAEDQGLLALGTQPADTAPPLPSHDFIKALNFPETAEDKDGFAALRRALRDRRAAQLVQAAQDVLTLMSQEGIYMDDLRPEPARPETWRQFAKGARGKAVAGLGGIHDRSSLALTAGRMKQDPIFRDAAHHFLRLFDRTFAEFEPTASDAEIQALADTRTARAFMLLARVTGTFD